MLDLCRSVEKGCARERDDEIWQRIQKKRRMQGNEGEIWGFAFRRSGSLFRTEIRFSNPISVNSGNLRFAFSLKGKAQQSWKENVYRGAARRLPLFLANGNSICLFLIRYNELMVTGLEWNY